MRIALARNPPNLEERGKPSMSELLKLFEFTAGQAQTLAKENSVTDTPIQIGNVTILPVYKLSCGFVGGGCDLTKKQDGIMGGASVRVSKHPVSFLAFSDGEIKLLHVGRDDLKKNGLIDVLTPLVKQMKDKHNSEKALKKK